MAHQKNPQGNKMMGTGLVKYSLQMKRKKVDVILLETVELFYLSLTCHTRDFTITIEISGLKANCRLFSYTLKQVG